MNTVVVLEEVNGKKVEVPKFCRFPVSESGRPRCRQGFIAFFLSLECVMLIVPLGACTIKLFTAIYIAVS